MRFLIVSAILVSVFASDVLDLSDSTFQSSIAGKDVILVEFFAPWCGHCKRLAPEYETAATALLKNDPPISLAKVDCTEAGKDTCSKYGVSGYPTLKVFRNGEFSEDYNGPREADGIIKTMKRQAGPSSIEIKDVDHIQKKLDNADGSVVVGFFSDGESNLAMQFMKTAASLRETQAFAHTYNAEVLSKYGYTDQVVLFYPKNLLNKFEEASLVYGGAEETQAMKSFITDNAHGLCGVRSMDNAAEFTKRPLLVAYYDLDYKKNIKGSNYWRNRVMKVGKKLVDEGKTIYFAVANAQEASREVEEYGLSFKNKPVVAIRDAKDQKFVMTAEFSMENLEAFINDFLDGKLEPYLKSEAVPDNSGNAVKVVVAKNFDEIVNDSDRDVLIEFYAPWCGHCKSLEPKYKELADKLADESGITIAKMDATANDVPSPYQVRGFPTLFFAPKGNKSNPKKYEGGREVDDFLKYLAKEATDGLKGFDKNGQEKKTEL